MSLLADVWLMLAGTLTMICSCSDPWIRYSSVSANGPTDGCANGDSLSIGISR